MSQDRKLETSRTRLALFAAAWSIYALIEMMASSWIWMWRPHTMLIVGATSLACLTVLQRPRSIFRLGILGACFGAFHASMFHQVWNHAWLSLFVNGAIVLTACEAWLATRQAPDRFASAFFQRLVPSARWMVVILYLLSFLHKLNYDYFDPSVSCGGSFYLETAEWLGVLPKGDWTVWPAVVGPVLIELAIPILLLIPRFTRFGMVLGLGFHFLIVLHPDLRVILPGFSAAMLAFYTLFLTPSQTETLDTLLRSRLRGRGRGIVSAPALAGLALVGFDLILTVVSPIRDFEPILLGARWLCIMWYATAGWELIRAAFSDPDRRLRPAPYILRPRMIAGVLLPLILLVNGFAPYLGLRNEETFSMFSNLRTEGADWNHFFLPRALKVFDNQDDIVEIQESSDFWLTRFREREERINYVELRRRASRRSAADLTVTYLRGGTRHQVDRSIDPNHEIFQPLRGFSSWLEWYRPVDLEGRPTRCRH